MTAALGRGATSRCWRPDVLAVAPATARTDRTPYPGRQRPAARGPAEEQDDRHDPRRGVPAPWRYLRVRRRDPRHHLLGRAARRGLAILRRDSDAAEVVPPCQMPFPSRTRPSATCSGCGSSPRSGPPTTTARSIWCRSGISTRQGASTCRQARAVARSATCEPGRTVTVLVDQRHGDRHRWASAEGTATLLGGADASAVNRRVRDRYLTADRRGDVRQPDRRLRRRDDRRDAPALALLDTRSHGTPGRRTRRCRV